jgi:hypothetical protein
MADVPAPHDPAPTEPPPRAFTQGVGTVFQFVGVLMFLAAMFVCCGSSLVSKDVAARHDLTRVGWGGGGGGAGAGGGAAGAGGAGVFYSAQRAISLSVTLAVFFGLALAGIGLGLQAQGRFAPWAAAAACGFATVFWCVQTVFFAQKLHSVLLVVLGLALSALFATLSGLALGALREMRRTPPPAGHEILPADYKVPYSHLHEDPPEVRLARELDQRRERLAVQQKELEMLEDRLRRKLENREERREERREESRDDAT